MLRYQYNHCTLSFFTQDERGRTPLHVASEIGHEDMVELLLGFAAQSNLVDSDQNTPLHFAVLFCNEYIMEEKQRIVQMLLNARSQCNIQNCVYRTAMHYASARGYTNIVEQLIDAGAQLNLTDIKGRTALYWAIERSQGDACHLLIRAGAWLYEVDEDTMTVLLTSDYVDFVISPDRQQYILNRYGQQRRAGTDRDDRTSVHWHVNIVMMLLAEGAKPENDNDIIIVAHLALTSRNLEMFTSLLNAGALPRIVGSDLGDELIGDIHRITNASNPVDTLFTDSMVELLYDAGIMNHGIATFITPYCYPVLSLQVLCRRSILQNMQTHKTEDFELLPNIPPFLQRFLQGCNL